MTSQVVNLLCYSVLNILNMPGFTRTTFRIFYIALTINIVLGIILILNLYAYGVTISCAVEMIF